MLVVCTGVHVFLTYGIYYRSSLLVFTTSLYHGYMLPVSTTIYHQYTRYSGGIYHQCIYYCCIYHWCIQVQAGVRTVKVQGKNIVQLGKCKTMDRRLGVRRTRTGGRRVVR